MEEQAKREPELKKGNYIITVVGEGDKTVRKVIVINSEVYVDEFENKGLAIDI